MLTFFWSHHHLGWGLFALIIYSVLMLLATDVLWRRWTVRKTRFLKLAVPAWALGTGLIVLVFWLSPC